MRPARARESRSRVNNIKTDPRTRPRSNPAALLGPSSVVSRSEPWGQCTRPVLPWRRAPARPGAGPRGRRLHRSVHRRRLRRAGRLRGAGRERDHRRDRAGRCAVAVRRPRVRRGRRGYLRAVGGQPGAGRSGRRGARLRSRAAHRPEAVLRARLQRPGPAGRGRLRVPRAGQRRGRGRDRGAPGGLPQRALGGPREREADRSLGRRVRCARHAAGGRDRSLPRGGGQQRDAGARGPERRDRIAHPRARGAGLVRAAGGQHRRAVAGQHDRAGHQLPRAGASVRRRARPGRGDPGPAVRADLSGRPHRRRRRDGHRAAGSAGQDRRAACAPVHPQRRGARRGDVVVAAAGQRAGPRRGRPARSAAGSQPGRVARDRPGRRGRQPRRVARPRRPTRAASSPCRRRARRARRAIASSSTTAPA